MFKKALAFLVCSFALVLPWKLRCLYAEAIGWVAQLFYFSYASILKIITKELEKVKKRSE